MLNHQTTFKIYLPSKSFDLNIYFWSDRMREPEHNLSTAFT